MTSSSEPHLVVYSSKQTPFSKQISPSKHVSLSRQDSPSKSAQFPRIHSERCTPIPDDDLGKLSQSLWQHGIRRLGNRFPLLSPDEQLRIVKSFFGWIYNSPALDRLPEYVQDTIKRYLDK